MCVYWYETNHSKKHWQITTKINIKDISKYGDNELLYNEGV